MRLSLSFAIAVWLLPIAVPAQTPPPATVPVGTVIAERKPVTQGQDFVGRVEAIDRVDIRARVTGYLEAVLFKEGEFVKEGTPLYRIEKGLFVAAVEQAQGVLAAAKAKKLLAAIQLERAEEMVKKQAGTVVARDQALTADRMAAADIKIDDANLDTAKINLGYTDILSPISGKIGRTSITKGNVVSPQSGTLATIVSQNPMYVLFPVSERDVLQVRASHHAIDLGGIKARLRFADDSLYGPVGHIDFVGVTVDRATDTVQMRAVFPNPSGELIDGELVTVNLESGTPEKRVLVPQAALLTDQQGVYVFIVQDGKAVVRRIEPGAAVGANVIVEKGLSGGEQVIVEGLQMLRPGMAVQASPMPALVN